MTIDPKPFKDAVAAAAVRTKAVVVNPGLFRELVSDGLVADRPATPGGLFAPLLALELAFYEGDVFVACDPRMHATAMHSDCLRPNVHQRRWCRGG